MHRTLLHRSGRRRGWLDATREARTPEDGRYPSSPWLGLHQQACLRGRRPRLSLPMTRGHESTRGCFVAGTGLEPAYPIRRQTDQASPFRGRASPGRLTCSHSFSVRSSKPAPAGIRPTARGTTQLLRRCHGFMLPLRTGDQARWQRTPRSANRGPAWTGTPRRMHLGSNTPALPLSYGPRFWSAGAEIPYPSLHILPRSRATTFQVQRRLIARWWRPAPACAGGFLHRPAGIRRSRAGCPGVEPVRRCGIHISPAGFLVPA
ncbi:hypothetical protein Achl_4486 (plasmid) [Pseudarthrobacter chlorophenolicus A6]|uniref:Uncharacterized protein n=1 Tax=Pseudarthrobacter chlorophenolicus (strain ATCC 700700 / DSM 12829 / CIP 107037 / JCM 12360 / KCTC 9906 / NCIMB 13794 / A6) TaxID=452863 RepID=B8HJ40_PSECP|nr:hypothetical protein Achl_4486 [Pseudarthrobacter chlorophenolicus A6]SDQ18130.1 hypothetical protein SAMN04489738_0543 [Pseudarthrobacter chlorophenolicus]